MHSKEYEWVKENRDVLLDFCSGMEQNDFTRDLGFGRHCVKDTLVHIADCYHAWLGSFVLLKTKTPLTPKADIQQVSIDEIRERFKQADEYVKEMFASLSYPLDKPIERAIPWREGGEPIAMTPGKLLIHTITHEYHHKGQIMAMARQMGYEPPNTDVLGTRD